MASKIQMQPFPGPPLPDRDDKGSPNVQIPNKHDEKHGVFNGNNTGSSSFSQNFGSTDVAVNNATTSGKFNPEVRSSGMSSIHLKMVISCLVVFLSFFSV